MVCVLRFIARGVYEMDASDHTTIATIKVWCGEVYGAPRWFVLDDYCDHNGERKSRTRDVRDPFRVQKETLYFDIRRWVASGGGTEAALIYNLVGLGDLFTNLPSDLAEVVQRRLATPQKASPPPQPVLATAPPTTPLKPACGTLLPQMPLPPHLHRKA